MGKMLFTDKITLYNHYKAAGKDAWNRTVLDGVQWTEKKEKAVSQSGVLSVADYISITIPERAGYVTPSEFIGSGFTFGLDNLDIVVCGETADEITGSQSLAVLKKAQHVYTISSVSDNTYRDYLKHWKVIAK